MTTIEKPSGQPELKEFSVHRDGRFDPIFGRIDLVAILISLLGVCLLGLGALLLAFIEIAKLVSSLWSDSFDRWLIIVLGMAIAWVVVRWKRLCVF